MTRAKRHYKRGCRFQIDLKVKFCLTKRYSILCHEENLIVKRNVGCVYVFMGSGHEKYLKSK